eukprot:10838630-Karenia_brevis.AAC.1
MEFWQYRFIIDFEKVMEWTDIPECVNAKIDMLPLLCHTTGSEVVSCGEPYDLQLYIDSIEQPEKEKKESKRKEPGSGSSTLSPALAAAIAKHPWLASAHEDAPSS